MTTRIITVIQLPLEGEENGKTYQDMGELSTPSRTLYVRNYDYSQGMLSWSTTPDLLKASRVTDKIEGDEQHQLGNPDFAKKVFIDRIGGKLRTFHMEINEVHKV